jgi:hypothetical protein
MERKYLTAEDAESAEEFIIISIKIILLILFILKIPGCPESGFFEALIPPCI